MATFVEELLVSLGIESDEASFKSAEALIEALAGATERASALIDQALEAAKEGVKPLSEELSVASEKMESVGNALSDAGKEAEDFSNATGKAATKSKQSIESLTATAVKAGALIAGAFTAVQGALTAMVYSFAQNASEVSRLASLSNLGVEEFQRLAAGASTVGIQQEKLADILKDTNDKVGDFLQTGAGPLADFFENIGPKVGITAEQFRGLSGSDALGLYVSGLEKANLSQAEMTFYMEAIASDSTLLLPLLKNNAQGFNELANEAEMAGAVMSKETVAAGKKLSTQFKVLGIWGEGLKNTISAELVPAVSELVESFTNFLRENRDLIKSGLVTFFKAATVAFKGLLVVAGLFAAFKVGSLMIAAAQGVAMLSAAIKGVRIAALLMNAAVLLIPIAVGLAVAAVALLAEDLYTFLTGGESQIGKLVEQFPLLGAAIEAVSAIVYALVGYATEVFNILMAIVTLDFDALMSAFSRLGDHIIDVFTRAGQAIYDALPSWVTGGISAGVDVASGAIAFGSDALSGAANFIGSNIPFMAPASVANVSNSSAPQDNRVYNITGTDIGEVKRVINENNAFSAKTIDTGREY